MNTSIYMIIANIWGFQMFQINKKMGYENVFWQVLVALFHSLSKDYLQKCLPPRLLPELINCFKTILLKCSMKSSEHISQKTFLELLILTWWKQQYLPYHKHVKTRYHCCSMLFKLVVSINTCLSIMIA